MVQRLRIDVRNLQDMGFSADNVRFMIELAKFLDTERRLGSAETNIATQGDAIDAANTDIAAANTAINALDARVDLIEGATTGWSSSVHGGSDLSVPASTPTTFLVDAASELADQLPSDVTDFWDANKITGREDDAIIVKVQFQCVPDDATASNINLKVDIGGAIGVVEEHDFPLVRGAMVSHPITFTFLAYTLDTWEANGGTITLEADGDCTIPAADRRVVIARAHKGR